MTQARIVSLRHAVINGVRAENTVELRLALTGGRIYTASNQLVDETRYGRGTKRRNAKGGFTSLGAAHVQLAAIERKITELKRDLSKSTLDVYQRNAKGELLRKAIVAREAQAELVYASNLRHIEREAQKTK